MGRMQCKGKGKGISSAVTPFKRRSARWVAHTPRSISELIVTMAKKGMSPSQIGVTIRDKEAVPSIKLLTGSKIVRLLKKNGKRYLTQALLPNSLKTFIVWLRRQWASEDISRNSERTKTQSTDSFWSNQEFTDWQDTTRKYPVSPTSGNSNCFLTQLSQKRSRIGQRMMLFYIISIIIFLYYFIRYASTVITKSSSHNLTSFDLSKRASSLQFEK